MNKNFPKITLIVVLILLTIVISIFLSNQDKPIKLYDLANEKFYIFFSVAAISTVAFGLGTSILKYLKLNEGSENARSLNNHRNVLRMFNEIAEIKFQLKESAKLTGKKEDVIEIAREIFESQIDSLTSEKITGKLREEFKNDFIINSKFSIIEKELSSIQERIYSQTTRLIGSARLNLTIGIVTTFLVVLFLMISVITLSSDAKNYTEFLMHFLPRLSLSIILEIFAYFFLRLYNKNLEETKYWNNELTNLELKGLALKTMILDNNPKATEKVATELLKTERNFILKKGETTVELEKEKATDSTNANALNSILKLIDLNKIKN